MIEVNHLTKSYGNVIAVHDVSFEVGAHEVVGFLGPNGAGKSTTLRIIAGFLGATRGRVSVNGLDIVEEPLRTRACIGYMPENVPLYPELRVEEYLRFRAELKRVPRAQRKEAVQRAMHDVHIVDHASVLIGELSKGYRQRVGLADAIVSRPAALVLDEPTAGLDPNQIREVRELIRSLAEHHAVLLSTHIMSEVEATCDRALVIHRGRIVAEGTLDDLRKLRRATATRFTLRGDVDKAQDLLTSLADVRTVKRLEDDEGATVLEVRWSSKAEDAGSRTEEAIDSLVAAGLKVRGAAPVKPSLEDVFALVTDEEQPDDNEEEENDEQEVSS